MRTSSTSSRKRLIDMAQHAPTPRLFVHAEWRITNCSQCPPNPDEDDYGKKFIRREQSAHIACILRICIRAECEPSWQGTAERRHTNDLAFNRFFFSLLPTCCSFNAFHLLANEEANISNATNRIIRVLSVKSGTTANHVESKNRHRCLRCP